LCYQIRGTSGKYENDRQIPDLLQMNQNLITPGFGFWLANSDLKDAQSTY
jgi:hypothetical protein